MSASGVCELGERLPPTFARNAARPTSQASPSRPSQLTHAPPHQPTTRPELLRAPSVPAPPSPRSAPTPTCPRRLAHARAGSGSFAKRLTSRVKVRQRVARRARRVRRAVRGMRGRDRRTRWRASGRRAVRRRRSAGCGEGRSAEGSRRSEGGLRAARRYEVKLDRPQLSRGNDLELELVLYNRQIGRAHV